MSNLTAGFARREITPPLGAPALYGITSFVQEIWDPLYATAVVLGADHERVAIVGADLLAFLERPYQEISRAAAAELSVSPRRVWLNASHTHSAPCLSTELQEVLDPYDLLAVDYDWARQVQRAIVAAVCEAAANAVPARVLTGSGRVDRIAANRRPKLADGQTVHRWGRAPDELRALPEGLIDPAVTAVRFDDRGGAPIGALVNYACHPTAAGSDLHDWISADFVGYGLRQVERALRVPCLFLQGTAGDVGTGKWIAGTPLEDATAMGQRLANGVFAALDALKPVAGDGLRVGGARVELAFDALPPVPELERRLEAAVAAADMGGIVATGDALIVARRAEHFRRAPVGAISIGDLAMSFLPAEVFVGLGLRIKQRSPFPATLVCAYNDNSLQYIPTAAAFADGAYEIDGGWRYVAPGAGELLADTALGVLHELHR